MVLSSFSRRFGSAIKVNARVKASLFSLTFLDNTIVDPQANSPDPSTAPASPIEVNYGPDLYVGSESSALLNNITFTVVPPSEADLPRIQKSRIGVQGASSTVFSRSPGGGGQDGEASRGDEIGADIFVKDSQTLGTTRPIPSDQISAFPSLSDASYRTITQVSTQSVC